MPCKNIPIDQWYHPQTSTNNFSYEKEYSSSTTRHFLTGNETENASLLVQHLWPTF